MHFANQNLLSLMHQSLDTQHVTAAYFTRYARSPETRTFNNYFRRTGPAQLFIPYLRKRPEYSLGRYITLHRRKQNPILRNFTSQIKTTILSTLQSLRQNYPAPTGRLVGMETSKPSPLGWAKVSLPFRPQDRRTEGAKYLSPGQRPGDKDHTIIPRPEKAAYNTLCESLCTLRQTKKTQNKPNFKASKTILTSLQKTSSA